MNISHAAKDAIFQYLQQLGLDLKIDVANLIEKHGTAIRYLQQTLLGANRAGTCLWHGRRSDPELTRESSAFTSRRLLARGLSRCIESARRLYLSQFRLAANRLSLFSTRSARASSGEWPD